MVVQSVGCSINNMAAQEPGTGRKQALTIGGEQGRRGAGRGSWVACSTSASTPGPEPHLVGGQALRAGEEARGGVREGRQDACVLHAHALLRLARHQRQRRQDVPARTAPARSGAARDDGLHNVTAPCMPDQATQDAGRQGVILTPHAKSGRAGLRANQHLHLAEPRQMTSSALPRVANVFKQITFRQLPFNVEQEQESCMGHSSRLQEGP